MRFFRTKAYLVPEDTAAGLAKDLKGRMVESPLLHNSFSPDIRTSTENGETYVAFSMKKPVQWLFMAMNLFLLIIQTLLLLLPDGRFRLTYLLPALLLLINCALLWLGFTYHTRKLLKRHGIKAEGQTEK